MRTLEALLRALRRTQSEPAGCPVQRPRTGRRRNAYKYLEAPKGGVVVRCRAKCEASARLVEEGVRRGEFAFIDFRDSSAGRQAYIQGSSLAVWQVLLLARAHRGSSTAVAAHLGWPVAKVQAALDYAEAFPEEIGSALADQDRQGFDALRRLLPNATEFVVGPRPRRRHAQAAAR